MNCGPTWLSTLFLIQLIGCSSPPKLAESHPLSKFNEDLVSVSENNMSELVIDCSNGYEELGIDISNKLSSFLENHVIEFDPDGHRIKASYRMVCGKEPRTIFSLSKVPIAKKYGKELVFIFHGGLVNREDGMKEALQSLLHMSDDEAYWNFHYPIFINWRTGGLDAYTEQTLYIRNGIKESVFGPASAPYNVLSDLGSGIADMFTSATLEGHRLFRCSRGQPA